LLHPLNKKEKGRGNSTAQRREAMGKKVEGRFAGFRAETLWKYILSFLQKKKRNELACRQGENLWTQISLSLFGESVDL